MTAPLRARHSEWVAPRRRIACAHPYGCREHSLKTNAHIFSHGLLRCTYRIGDQAECGKYLWVQMLPTGWRRVVAVSDQEARHMATLPMSVTDALEYLGVPA